MFNMYINFANLIFFSQQVSQYVPYIETYHDEFWPLYRMKTRLNYSRRVINLINNVHDDTHRRNEEEMREETILV